MYFPVLLQLGDLILQRYDHLLVLRKRKYLVRDSSLSLREFKYTSSDLGAINRRVLQRKVS